MCVCVCVCARIMFELLLVCSGCRLHSDLRQSLEASGEGSRAPGGTTAVEDLQHQLDMLSKV